MSNFTASGLMAKYIQSNLRLARVSAVVNHFSNCIRASRKPLSEAPEPIVALTTHNSRLGFYFHFYSSLLPLDAIYF
jgi:hypothetical protein